MPSEIPHCVVWCVIGASTDGGEFAGGRRNSDVDNWEFLLCKVCIPGAFVLRRLNEDAADEYACVDSELAFISGCDGFCRPVAICDEVSVVSGAPTE